MDQKCNPITAPATMPIFPAWNMLTFLLSAQFSFLHPGAAYPVHGWNVEWLEPPQ
jgi:hypothetical protein